MENALQTTGAGCNRHGKLSLAFTVLVFFAPLVFLRSVWGYAEGPKQAYIQIGIVILCVCWMFDLMANDGRRVSFPKVAIPALILIIYMAASTMWSINPYIGRRLLVHYFICLVALVFVFNQGDKQGIFAALFLSAVIVSMIGIAQKFGFSWIPQSAPPSSTFGNKNVASHFVAICMPLALEFYEGNKKPLVRSGMYVCVLFIVLATSKAALLVLTSYILIGGGWFFYKKGRKNELILMAVMSVLAIYVFATSPVYRQVTKSFQGRLELWGDTIEMARDYPLYGVGFENLVVHYPKYYKEDRVHDYNLAVQTQWTHNDYLQAFAELGATGMVLLTVLTVIALRNYSFSLVPTLSVAGIMIAAMFSFPFHRAMPPFIMAILFGLESKQ